jgi:hypothetical protein
MAKAPAKKLHTSMYLSSLGFSQQRRFEYLGEVTANTQNCISNWQKAVELTNDEHLDKSMHLSNLADAALPPFRDQTISISVRGAFLVYGIQINISYQYVGLAQWLCVLVSLT